MAIAGLLMIVMPGRMLWLNQKFDIWIDTSRWFQSLDQPHQAERIFYRHHIIMGLLIMVGAIYSLRYLWTLQQSDLLLLLPVFSEQALAEWFHGVISLFLLVGNGIALVVGFIVLVRPSLLKRVEVWANTWVDSGRILRRLDSRMEASNQLIARHMRLVGLLVVIGSLYIMTHTIAVVVR